MNITALIVILAAAPAAAWGPLEHKAIALAAQHRLSPQALDGVRAILGKDANLDQIANCADSMLYTTEPLNCGGLFWLRPDPAKLTGSWHYIDIPISATDVAAATLMTHCPNATECVVAQIRRQAAILADPKSSIAQKQVALMFLVHFVGDENQPLHCADDDDMGGNKKALVFLGAKKNLHSLWDDMIMPEDWRIQSTMDPAPLARELEGLVKGADTRGDFVSRAAAEAFLIAQKQIYPGYADYVLRKAAELDASYQKPMQPIAKAQMAKAAGQLAALIESALGPNPAPVAQSALGGSQKFQGVRKAVASGRPLVKF